MAETKISEMGYIDYQAFTGDELVPIVQSLGNYRTSIEDLSQAARESFAVTDIDAVDPGDVDLKVPTVKAVTDYVAAHSGGGGSGVVIVDKFSLSSAEILALNTTPKTLIAAPGAGKAFSVMKVSFRINFNTTAYIGNSMQVLIGGSIVANQSTVYTDSQDAFYTINSSATVGGSISDYENQAMTLFIIAANPTAGNGTLDVYITYTVITL